MSISVIIVDRRNEDRDVLQTAITTDSLFKILSTGKSGMDAISLANRLKPNLLILTTSIDDLPLLTVIRRIMQHSPIPVLIVDPGDHEVENKSEIIKYGLVDWMFAKRTKTLLSLSDAGLITRSHILSKLNISKFEKQLNHIHNNPGVITSAASQSLSQRRYRIEQMINKASVNNEQLLSVPSINNNEGYKGSGRLNRIIIIGTSTGGPKLLSEIVPKLPPNLPPILLVQHMPEGFTQKFSERLNRSAQLTVKEAMDGEIIVSGKLYVAPGGYHLRVIPNPKGLPIISLMDSQPVNFVKPSVDVTLYSAVDVYHSGVISLILTGMGSDGKNGSMLVKKMGGVVLALHEKDTDIYGMNRSVIESGIVDEILKKQELISGLIRALEGRLRGYNL